MAPRPHAPVRLRRERWREPEPRARSRRRVHGKARSAGRQGEALMARRKEHRYSGDNGRGRNEGSDEKGFHVRERQGRVSYLPRRGERAWTRGFSIALRQILLPVAPRRASCSMRSIRRCRPAPCPAIDCGRRGLKRLHLGRGRSGPRALGQSCAASADASLGRGTCERDCGLKGSRCGLRPRRQCRMFCHVGRAGHGVRFRRRGGRLGEAAVSGNEGHLRAGSPVLLPQAPRERRGG
jgi:hypothetical protein